MACRWGKPFTAGKTCAAAGGGRVTGGGGEGPAGPGEGRGEAEGKSEHVSHVSIDR